MIPLRTGAVGIDVSHWNTINWSQVHGIDFVLIAGGDGLAFVDPEVQNNIRGAESLRLPWGLYWVVRVVGTAVVDIQAAAKSQAARLLQEAQQAGGYHPALLPPVADCENVNPTADTLVALAAFMDAVDSTLNSPTQRTMLYCDEAFLTKAATLPNVGLIADRDLWQAFYNPHRAPVIPPFKPAVLQQFTDNRRVAGAPRPVDWDRVLVGSLPSLNANEAKVKQAIATLSTCQW